MERKNYFLPTQLIKRLEKLVKKTGLSAAEHVRRALEQYLKGLGK